MKPAVLSIVLALTALGPLPAGAEGLDPPSGAVVLTISGDIARTNGTGVARFDLPMLQRLGAVDVATTTIWTEGEHVFTGVPLARLMQAVEARGDTLRAIALNDYAVTIPMTDAVEGRALVAYHMDGAEMSVRDKGPLWVIYPYDADPEFQAEVIYSRSIWQLDRIEVGD